MNIAIIGSGDLGRQIAHLAKANSINVIGFFDDFAEKDSLIEGIRVIGSIQDIAYNSHLFTHLVIGIGYKHFEVRESHGSFI